MIASYITAHEKYDYAPIPIFMLAKNGEIVAEDAAFVRFGATEAYIDSKTGKPVAGVTKYFYDDGAHRRLLPRTPEPNEVTTAIGTTHNDRHPREGERAATRQFGRSSAS